MLRPQTLFLRRRRPFGRLRVGRAYASVSSVLPDCSNAEPIQQPAPSSELDDFLLASLSASVSGRCTTLRDIVHQYVEKSGCVLASSLPYESRPTGHRRPTFDNGHSVVMVAHCVQSQRGDKVTVSSGFALSGGDSNEGALIITCAHTLEEIRRSPLLLDDGVASGSYIVSGAASLMSVVPVAGVVSAIPRSDILLMRTASSDLLTLPVSPYPAQRDTTIRAHFVAHTCPQEAGWTPWVGNTCSKWVRGTVVGYRDFAGRETNPGTYDSLSHLLFSPLPTPGSSGGPIVDEESGAVVGIVLGTRMDNRVEGVRGWGVPSETIFEMFSLPGFRRSSL
ncbi:hypothetical protein DFH07DRAFT_787991 [Mycena maculata]|uniref:Trypsin-like serine protease n=1 Tax=Mycena maculata TaxID=230809 RepID=A0AAD7P145_9AGAR|nr:hypothetical protein DFH07DRAFT_787991 [Mycena maculata]